MGGEPGVDGFLNNLRQKAKIGDQPIPGRNIRIRGTLLQQWADNDRFFAAVRQRPVPFHGFSNLSAKKHLRTST